MKKKFLSIVILLLSCCVIYGQISTEEEPISFKNNIPNLNINKNTQKILPSLDMESISKEDNEDEKNGVPPRFGYRHTVNYDLNNSGEWTIFPDGSKIWRLSIYCPKALSINLLYDKFWVPDEAKFFIYSNDHKHNIGAFTSENNKGKKDDVQGFATGLIYSDQITLEYYLPKEVEDTSIISIAYVIQGYRYILLPENMEAGYGQSGNCQVNVNCSEGQNWQKEKNAVAMILVNGNRYCTGSLINTTAKDNRPLFLTADHCLGGWANNNVKYDAINNPNLNHYSFYWHYESPGCTNSSPTIRSTSGAKVVANNSASDFALLQLTEDPAQKTNVIPYYLGWDRSGNTGTGGVGIHHPAGDLKKIATYNSTPQSSGNYWRINWIRTSNGYSVTEGGSSGSSLLNNNRRVIGQLYGGSNVNCSDPANDYALYGKISVSWNGSGEDIRRRLQPWLDPNNTQVTVLDGMPLSPPCTTPVVNFTNQTVTANRTITSQCNIYVKNVTLRNNVKLILDAVNTTTIDGPFDTPYGAQLEIR